MQFYQQLFQGSIKIEVFMKNLTAAEDSLYLAVNFDVFPGQTAKKYR